MLVDVVEVVHGVGVVELGGIGVEGDFVLLEMVEDRGGGAGEGVQ